MGSALLNPAAHVSPDLAPNPAPPEPPEQLRREVAARLAAHRERRLRAEAAPPQASLPLAGSSTASTKSRVAAAVAERYAHAQSYRAFLAAEAERAIQQARAAAEVAARNADAVAAAQQQLLQDLAHSPEAPLLAAARQTSAPTELPLPQALWPDLQLLDEPPAPLPREPQPKAAPKARAPRLAPTPFADTASEPAPPAQALRVILYDHPPADTLSPVAPPTRSQRTHLPDNDPEALALDAEISFRQAPVFEEPAGPPMPLPANLIEFPRQLVAPRKARPRYAEGPLRDEAAAASPNGQLRIFEVEPAQISTQPAVPEPASHPESQWISLWLDSPGAHPAPAQHVPGLDHFPAPHPAHTGTQTGIQTASPHTLYTAPLSRRLLAGSIDIALSASAGLICASAFAATTALLSGRLPTRLEILLSTFSAVARTVPLTTIAFDTVAALLLLSIALQALFFTFSHATPGMRLTRLALCSFADDNPTRTAMRLRVPALILSTACFGLGFWWALLDQDHLTWHDLLSRTYQRTY